MFFWNARKGNAESQGPAPFGISSFPPDLMKVRKQGLGGQSEPCIGLGSIVQNDLLVFFIENLGNGRMCTEHVARLFRTLRCADYCVRSVVLSLCVITAPGTDASTLHGHDDHLVFRSGSRLLGEGSGC